MFVYQVCNGKIPQITETVTVSGNDCVKETNKDPKVLTLRYTGENCTASDHGQDANKVICSGDPQEAPYVYVTVESEGKADKAFFSNRKVPLGGSFEVDAAIINESKLKASIVIYLKNAQGQTLHTVDFHTSGSQPLVIGDKFGGLELVGYEAENGNVCSGSIQICSDGCNQGIVYINGAECNASSSPTNGSNSATIVSSRVSASWDDAEENAQTGAMYMNSSDLEMVNDPNYIGADQIIGMRFRDITIPQGATIESAAIQFFGPDNESRSTSLLFRGHNTDNATGFTTASRNISSRPSTAASVNWNNIPNWSSGNTYKSPDLSAIIQEIVNREGWASGNSMALMVTGFGERTAWSYDGYTSLAPQLVISYSEGGEPDGNEVCPPPEDCACEGIRSAIGVMYIGNETTEIIGYLKAGGGDKVGSYRANPGDFIAFSSWYRDKGELKEFYLKRSGGPEIQIAVDCSTSIMGNVYGDFKVVYQADMAGNICQTPYSSCQILNLKCNGQEAMAAEVQLVPDANVQLMMEPVSSQPSTTIKDVNLYPNPARDAVYLNLKDFTGKAVDISIYDSVSRLFKRIQVDVVNGAPVEMRLDGIVNGLYTVVVLPDGEQPVLKKLVIAK